MTTDVPVLEDVEMKEPQAPPSNSATSAGPSTLQRNSSISFFSPSPKHVVRLLLLVACFGRTYLLLHFWGSVSGWNFSDLKEIVALIETGAYAKEIRRIVRAVRLTIVLRKKLTSRVISAFLGYALVPGSEVHSRLSSYLSKVTIFNLSLNFLSRLIYYIIAWLYFWRMLWLDDWLNWG